MFLVAHDYYFSKLLHLSAVLFQDLFITICLHYCKQQHTVCRQSGAMDIQLKYIQLNFLTLKTLLQGHNSLFTQPGNK
jgi:hypothetical protein